MTPGQESPRHVPQRTCIVCRKTAAKRGLIRVVRAEGIQVDLMGKKPGRGAYLCSRRACWEAALTKVDRLERALRTKVTAEDRQKLAEYARDLKDD